MLTRIEVETMSLIKAACREYIDNNRNNEIDWEQRRYEIARDLYVRMPERGTQKCVELASLLIEELKRKED